MGPIVFAGSGWARLRSGVSANLSRVDRLGMVLLANVNDESLLLQMTNGLARHGTVDLQALAHHRWRDQLCLWDFLHHLVVGGLVKLNHICKFLLDLALRPLFLLRLATSLGSFHLRFLRLLIFQSGCNTGDAASVSAHWRAASPYKDVSHNVKPLHFFLSALLTDALYSASPCNITKVLLYIRKLAFHRLYHELYTLFFPRRISFDSLILVAR